MAAGGRVVIECLQEAGYLLDPTDVRRVDFDEARRQCEDKRLTVTRQYSCPFPGWARPSFVYNHFETLAVKTA